MGFSPCLFSHLNWHSVQHLGCCVLQVSSAPSASSCWSDRSQQKPDRQSTLAGVYPYNLLERLMAWGGGLGLKAIGQPVKFMNDVITLPGGSVRVDWGCNGFDMALNVAVAGLLIGLFFRQRRLQILLMVGLGIILALLFNVPRIMLLAMSDAYWGQVVFGFWHGFWGGQIFSALLFTTYYYVVMAIIKRNPGNLRRETLRS